MMLPACHIASNCWIKLKRLIPTLLKNERNSEMAPGTRINSNSEITIVRKDSIRLEFRCKRLSKRIDYSCTYRVTKQISLWRINVEAESEKARSAFNFPAIRTRLNKFFPSAALAKVKKFSKVAATSLPGVLVMS